MDPSPFMNENLKGVTQEEISKLTKAMKDGEFRNHMDDYCKEVSDPAHRKEYIQYLEQLEAKGEMPDGQCLLRTQPGCCAKTQIRFKNGQTQKLFINIVHSDQLDDFSMGEKDSKGQGRHVHLPYSLSPPRPDRDLKDQYCMTCDCAVSSYTFFQGCQNPQILKMIIDTAADGLAERFLKGYEEVKKDFKLLEKMKCKGGFPMPMSVKVELLKDKGGKKAKRQAPPKDAVTPSELKEMRAEAKAKRDSHKHADEAEEEDEKVAAAKAAKAAKEKEIQNAGRIRVPTHRLIHSGSVDLADYMENKSQPLPATTTVPRQLRLVVELPTVKKVSDVSLEVTCNNVVVEVEGKFYLDLPLSYEVEETNGTAKFDKVKQELTLELPVVPKPPVFRPEAVAGAPEGEEQSEAPADVAKAVTGELRDGIDEEASEEESADWIDRAGDSLHTTDPATNEAPSSPSVEKKAEAVPRQRLEFDGPASSLHIAGAQLAAQAAGDGKAAEPLVQAQEADEDETEDLPSFVASDSFEGSKAGYFFGTGEEGLGYYRDRRQSLRPKKAEEAEIDVGPLVVEVPALEEVAERAPLPADLQQYVEETSALSRRIGVEECGGLPAAQCDFEVQTHQNGQNAMVLVTLPAGDNVADVQVAVTGHRFTLAFCTRPDGDDAAPWTRHRLRRTLGGTADGRQWHAEVADGRLQILLRKVRGTAPWPRVLEEAAVAASEPWEPSLGAATAAAQAAAPTPDAAGRGPHSPSSSSQPQAAQNPAEADTLTAAAHEVEAEAQDSAELDVAAPVGPVGPQAAAAAATVVAGVAQLTATAAMVQSAAVMGQGVLLRNRMMYQLL